MFVYFITKQQLCSFGVGYDCPTIFRRWGLMSTQLLAVLAVAMISLGIFGLIGLWAYTKLERKPRRVKRRDADLIVTHRFKSDRRRKAMRRALAAPALASAPVDDSVWRRPGGPLQPPEPKPLIFGEGQPRHIRIDDTPRVIIPHETFGPEPTPRLKPRLPDLGRTQRSQATALIKTVRVDPEQQRTGFMKPMV
jgi:hypothetical protein